MTALRAAELWCLAVALVLWYFAVRLFGRWRFKRYANPIFTVFCLSCFALGAMGATWIYVQISLTH